MKSKLGSYSMVAYLLVVVIGLIIGVVTNELLGYAAFMTLPWTMLLINADENILQSAVIGIIGIALVVNALFFYVLGLVLEKILKRLA